jgi:hypothetical protein
MSTSIPVIRKSQDIIVVKGESWNIAMTTPNSPNSRPAKIRDHEEAYLLGELIAGVVEDLDRRLTIDDLSPNFLDSLDRVKKDRLECKKDKIDTYESRSREIDGKWKRY